VLVDGFILPGHVSTIIGKDPYNFIADDFNKLLLSLVFEAFDILSGIRMLLEQISGGKARVENQYTKVVKR